MTQASNLAKGGSNFNSTGNLSLTTGVTGTLPVANGGTGATTLTANNVLLGNGTSALQVVAPSTTGNVLTSDGTTWTSSAPAAGGTVIPAGTVILFYQAAAPTGFTQVTTQNNKALRVVSGTGGVAGGTTAFSTVFANQTVTTSVSISGTSGATTLSTSQIPSHTHPLNSGCDGSGGNTGGGNNQGTATGSAGGGGSHTHSFSGSGSGTSSAVTLNVQYIDIILCSKN